MFTMATRKRVILTLDSKVKVIRQHEKGTGLLQLEEELCVKSTFLPTGKQTDVMAVCSIKHVGASL